MKSALTITAVAVLAALPLHADLLITEVAPWGSGATPYAADWFELTNTGTSAISISGWKMDDNSNSFSLAVPMSGISSIAAGESVIFMETSGTAIAPFINTWFGGSTTVQIGMYSGSGVGLSTTNDAVNVFDSAGNVLARVDFNASTNFRSFDNAAGLNNTTISTLSTAGVNGAFAAPNDAGEIGSPGSIAASVPEPTTGAALLTGLTALVGLRRRRA